MSNTMPCTWDVVIPSEMCSGWNEHPESVRDAALWLASTYLWAATGRQYGLCPVTVRRPKTVTKTRVPRVPGLARPRPGVTAPCRSCPGCGEIAGAGLHVAARSAPWPSGGRSPR